MTEAGNAVEIASSERDLLLALRESLCALDPDLLIGWDVASSVIIPLKERFTRCGIPFNLGRTPRLSRVVPASARQLRWSGSQAIIEGRQILDAQAIIRSGQHRFADSGLDTVSREVLGRVPTSTAERARAVLNILN
ncbi:hypothetical protein JW848_02850, partial [Candidatus Bipolaricaulota bacterium]|nr:hypothetical protein [Candidatus Bipolaricaulota bacterium]